MLDPGVCVKGEAKLVFLLKLLFLGGELFCPENNLALG